jgi:hypothetical protein
LAFSGAAAAGGSVGAVVGFAAGAVVGFAVGAVVGVAAGEQADRTSVRINKIHANRVSLLIFFTPFSFLKLVSMFETP